MSNMSRVYFDKIALEMESKKIILKAFQNTSERLLFCILK
jgi:hypothetical protein